MSRLYGLGNVFGSRTKKPPAARKRKDRRPQAVAAPESLERRAMLAFSTLPGSGDLLGAPIFISTDTADQLHEMTVVLDDVNTPGFVTATITTKVNGLPDQTTQVFNFSDILFTAANDTDGSIVNRVSLWTSYEANLLGQEMAPSDQSSVGLSTNWIVSNSFGALGTVVLDMFNADALTVTGGVLGGTDSTIRGEFESPTLPGLIDSTNPDTYANISLFSGVGIGDAASADPIVASALTLKAQTGGIDLSQDVFTRFDLNLEAAQDITLRRLVEVKEGDVSLFSSSGSIAVLELMHVMAGSITIDSDCDEVGIERLCAFENITINAPQGVKVNNELRTENGSITVTTAAGPMELFDVFAGDSITLSAAQSVLLSGELQTVNGSIDVRSESIVNIARQILSGDAVDIYGGLGVNDFLAGGVTDVIIVSSGAFYEFALVEIAPPASGVGRAAIAQALTSPVVIDPLTGEPSGGVVTKINILDRGYGYAPNERPLVTIIGSPERSLSFATALGGTITAVIPAGDGATAFATVALEPPSIRARTDITLASDSNLELSSLVQSKEGAISAFSASGNVALLGVVHAVAGEISATAIAGSVTFNQLEALGDVTLTADQQLTVAGSVTSNAGDIALSSTNRAIDLSEPGQLVHAVSGSILLESKAGGATVQQLTAGTNVDITTLRDITTNDLITAGGAITLASEAGQASVQNLVAEGDIAVTSQGLATLSGDVLAKAGKIDVTSTAGAINLTANLAAAAEVTLDAAASVIQPSASGISSLALSAGGSGYVAGAVVTIAPPAGGGTAARATAVVESGVVTAVIITSAGNGYAVGESPLVTITGNLAGGGPNAPAQEAGSGAAAVAAGPTAIPGIKGSAITVRGDAGVTLSSFVIAENGAIVVASSSGGLSLDSGSVLLQAENGSVTLNADAGSVSVRNVLSRDTIDVAGFSAVSLAGEIRSVSGDIEAVSLAGSILLAANLKATSGKMDFEAHGSITQASESGLSGIELIAGGTEYTLGATVEIAKPIGGGGIAAKAVATLEAGVVTGLTLTDAGSGYAVGENPSVTISGGATAGAVQGGGAAARAFGPVAQQQVRAGNGIQFKAGTGIDLRSNIVSDKGDITVATQSGNLNLDSGALTLQALGGNLQLTSDAGVVSAQRLLAEQDITINAYSNASVIGEGKAGSDIIVTSDYGKASVTNLFAGDAITVSGRTAVSLAGEIDAGGSGLTAKSSAGTVQFSANIKAENGKIELEAAGSVNQLNSTGISAITLRSGGSGYAVGAQVTVAPPSAGGTAATAEAVVEFGVITSIIITQPGSGYSVGESPAVTITGNLSAGGGGPNPAPPAPVGGGASAVAAGPLTAPRVVAGEQIKVVGNTGVSLNSLVESKNILVQSDAGVLSLDAASLKMKAQEAITLKTELGAIAAGNLYGGAVTVTAAGNLSLVGEIQSDSTGLTLESSKGAVTLGANLRADSGSISVKSAGSLVQAATGGLSELELTAGGSGYTSRVVVTIAPPQGDGVAAQAAAVVTNGAITALILTSPGSGYAVGETPVVTFAAGPADGLNPGGGGSGASARAIGPVSLPQIFATDDIAIESGASATLTTLVRSTGGDVSIRAKTGDLALDAGSFAVVTESAASAVALQADTGSINLRRIDAAGSITVLAGRSVSVSAITAEGAVTIDATTGVTVEQRVESGGKASISALNGPVTVGDVFADNGIDVKTGAGFLLQRVLRSDNAGISIESVQDIALGTATTDSSIIALGGDITAKTKASGIALDARLVATGRIDLGAQGAVTQAFGTGVIRFEIVNGGLRGTLPTVTLTVAGPAAGGEAATATAVVGSRQVGVDRDGAPVFNYFIESILVTNVGRGYAVGENPIVTVTGIDGAVIQAFGPVALRTLDAGAGVTIAGGDDVILVNTVTASAGDIAVGSVSGNLRLGSDTFLANAVAGSVTLKSDAGAVVVERMVSGLDSVITGMMGVTVERDVTAGRDITVTAAAGPATVLNLTAGNAITVTSQGLATVSGDVVAKAGGIGVVSTAGGIDLTANVRAFTGSVTLTSNLGLLQTVSSGVTDIVLLNGGRITGAAPTVTVTIAPPADPRGVAATASAQVTQVGTDFFFGPIWSITQIEITSPGSGYAAGEAPQVTIAGIPNAAAQAIVRNAGTVGTIVAERDLTVVAGGDVEAVSTFRANTGDVSIRSIAGSLVLGADTFLANAVAGSVTLQSDAGTVAVERMLSGLDSVITGTKGVTVERSTVAGRDIAVAAIAGPATVTDLTAGRALAVTSNGLASLNGDVVATAGAITVTSTSNAIDLRANMNAAGESISLTANLGVVQSVNSGVSRVTLVSGGQSVGATPPAVTVTIAGPAAGGLAATATAVITQTAQTGTTPIWTISQIIITNPGSRYAINESPLVTITGMPGAAAVAFARTSDPAVVADDKVTVKAGGDVTLVSAITATKGDIGISSTTGDLNLSATGQLVHAVEGSVLLETLAGGIDYQRIIAAEDITMRSHETLTINNPLTTDGGDVTLVSTGNSVVLTASVLAADTLAITAKTGINQTDGLVKAANLTLDNLTATPIVVASGGNDVDRFAAKNVGAVTFADANGFRVGISSVGPMGVEVSGSTVNLAAGGTIRVVAGIDTQGLTITAGSVEYVTTNSGDNPGQPFAGTLRDMMAVSNQNLDRQTLQAMVFDEQLVDGIGNPLPAVGTITVGTASLPAFTRPITFDGSRVLPTAPGGRLGLLGRAGLPSGLHLGLGSSGSRVTGAAVFGFTTGSGVIVESANNTVDNMYVGLRSNGVTVSPNRLGVNVSGVRANSNTIGTVMYNSLTDGVVSTLRVTNRGEQPAGSTPNVTVTIAPPVGGGTAATAQAVVEEIRPGLYGLTGLVLTNPGSGYEIGENPRITFVGMPGATANSIVAIQTKANHFTGNSDAAIVVQRGASNNLIAGNVVGVPGRTPNRTGVRIDGGSGNQVGTAAQTTDDLTPTPSNLIRGNTHYGVEIRNVRGATTVVENNIVAHNAVREGQGVHGVGVLNSMNVRIGGVSELAANQIHSQTHGAGVHLSGSTNVAIVGNHIGTDGYHLTANGHFPDAVPVWPDMGGGLGNSPFMGNGRHGIDVFGRSRDVEITANRIVDNRGSGVAIASGSSGVVLTRNEIGAWVHPVTGNIHDAGNLADGVTITAANGNTVGSGNVIGFNKGSGVHVENSVAAGLATGNRVAGAEIFGNSGHGVNVSGSSRQTIGGAGGDDGNIIKENLLDGIRLGADPRVRASAAPHGNLVSGNFVGTNDNEEIDRNWGNRNGISVIDGVSNVLSRNTVMNNRDYGIEIAGGVGNTVGGQTTNEGNFIGYNFSDGVFIHDNASTRRDVGVTGTAITAQGAGYAASRTNVIFTAPAVEGGVPARGVAIVSADGRVTGIRLTSSGSGYTMGEAVSVTIFDPLATASATATVTLGTIQAVSSISRGHVVSGNEIEANAGAGVHVMGDRTTEVQVGQNPDNLRSTGAANKISFHHVGVLVNAAMRTRVQGNVYGDNDSPLELINGANDRMHGTQTEVLDLRSTQMGIGQTLVTGELVNGGAFHQYSIDVYDTPYWDINYDTGVASGHQMRRFLGRALVTTDGLGRATISMTISQAMELGDYVSVKVTSTRYEPGTTVGVFHSQHRHRTPLMPTPSPSNPTPTPTPGSSLTPPSNSSGTTGQIPTPPRGSVPPSRL